MRAVVLVGGEGTRLRPLTETTPKPLLPLMGRPFLHHVLDHLAAHGVHEVILSSPYLEAMFEPFIDARHGDPKISWITEAQPLGTGGAVLNALDHAGDEPFFVLNGDILTDLDLTAMHEGHRARRAQVSISTFHVEDARPFGLVITGDADRITEFREKPEQPIPGNVNAGTYLIDPAVLRGFELGVNTSIEREIFPALIDGGTLLSAFLSDCYWMDLGTPEKYLQAHFDILEGRISFEETFPAPFIAPGATIEPGAGVGRLVVAAGGARVAAGAEIEDSVLLVGAQVGARAMVRSSILGPGSNVGEGAEVTRSVLGEGAKVAAGAVVADEKVRRT